MMRSSDAGSRKDNSARLLKSLCGVGLLAALLGPPAVLAQADSALQCASGTAALAAERFDCFGMERLERVTRYREILSYSKAAPDEHSFREALVSAWEGARCINNFRLVPEAGPERDDFHCLQKSLLEFYDQVSRPQTEPQLQFQDRLARASTRIHYCMIDQELPLQTCLNLIGGSLKDYQAVFAAAPTPRADLNQEAAEEGREAAGPTSKDLDGFLELGLENASRAPRVLGKPFGQALGPVLCDSMRLFPERRSEVAELYNVLIRFDFADIGPSTPLYRFLQRLRGLFRVSGDFPTHLELDPEDWSPTPAPCSGEEWALIFPSLTIKPGMRLPGADRLQSELSELWTLLTRTAELTSSRNHLWKPFLAYGNLLYNWGQSLREAGLRRPEVAEARHLLMERARDAFLMRTVDPSLHPIDTRPLEAAVENQIAAYGGELLRDLRLNRLKDFGEEYLATGEPLLKAAQKKQLHRLLAIGYSLDGDEGRALAHLQDSDLDSAGLQRILSDYRRWGVGVRPEVAPGSSVP